MNAVNPPKRSVSISRSPERFPESNGRPSLKYLNQVHWRHFPSEPQHSEHEKQRERDDGRDQQRAKATQAVRKEEEHVRRVAKDWMPL
ncbi:hypothetical protein JIR23_04670 [Bradyrhizobium diazoefficiens]|nr:hypothetical protein [Bradyrhizobium diazoefficiens]QQN65104.1 hypothetical protein JIR23_04670 [Bradyrhizobium diazoefficiens]